MRKIKPVFVGYPRWVFVTISRTYTLTEKHVHTRLSKCLIQWTKSETSHPGRWAEENLPFRVAFILVIEMLWTFAIPFFPPGLSIFCCFPRCGHVAESGQWNGEANDIYHLQIQCIKPSLSICSAFFPASSGMWRTRSWKMRVTKRKRHRSLPQGEAPYLLKRDKGTHQKKCLLC